MNAENQTPDPDTPAAAAHPRRWPRRVAIGVVVTGVVLGGAVWYLGRETTLQMIAQRVANASGGKLTLSGVSGSLYGHMHVQHVVFRTETSVITADNIDIDWKPWQYLSRGVEINKLYAQSLRMEMLKETDEPATMPERLAPPFKIAVEDARLAKLVMVNKGVETPIENIRAGLHGDKQQWKLDYASASTPWGQVAANGTINNAKPYKLAADATLSQDKSQPGSIGAQLKLHAGGDLQRTVLDASGQAARAQGTANLVLSPFAEIPLQALTLNARNIDPGFFNPSLPTADLNLAVSAKLDPNRNVSGSVDLTNDGPQGTIDQQRLPLRAMRGKLGGNLSAMQLGDVLLDLGGAGRFTGSGSVQRGPEEKGIGTAQFTLHTDKIDLKQIHSSMKPTAIAGDLKIANEQDTQTLNVNLSDAGLRLVAEAALANNELTVRQARLSAGKGSVALTGNASLLDKKPFKVNAVASHLDPAAFGDFPKADINADINAAGALAPQWQVAADFALRPSRLFDQALSGRGKLAADAGTGTGTGTGAQGSSAAAGLHVHDVNATLALGQNAVDLRGAFGRPGETLSWRLDGKQLNAVRADLYGSLLASGVVSGTMAAPRTTFDVDARGLGWVPAQRKNNNGSLRATGEAWLAGPENARVVEVKAKGGMQRLNPAAFGAPLAGSISGNFDANGRTGANMGGSVNLDILRESTLSNSPLWGYAKLTADKRHVSNADVDLHLGANVIAAKGAFGSGKDTLNWRIDAPQLAAVGPDFGGSLRGSGALSGTMDMPSLSAALEGQNIRLMGTQNLRSLRATANLGAGRGAADPLALDVQVTDYSSGDTRIAAARLQSTGTRGAHTITASARSDAFDAAVEVRGGLSTDKRNNSVWAGTLQTLQNRGRYALTLAAPTPIRIAAAPGAGIAGLAKPEQIAFNGAVVRLPAGAITVESLSKVGPRWSSRGSATGVPVSYLAQASDAVRQNLRGDMTLGAQWALDMQMPAAANAVPALNGNLHVFREKGDLIAGETAPVVLGLRQLDLRADVAGGALRAQLALDGSRVGSARVDATAQMIRGRIDNDSPLRLTANASLGSLAWVSPLIGQPGLELDGALNLAVNGAGTVGAPTLNGTVNGDNLSARWPDQGIRLQRGQLRAVLAGDQLQLQRLTLEGASGRATADGNIRFANGEATMNLRLVADKLAALSRPDRTLILSGQASVVRDANRFAVEGKFKADRALIELAPVDRPTISDDVIVLGRGNEANAKPAPKAKEVPLTIDLAADLGDDFHLRGMGADAYLAGAVQVRMVGDKPPRITGSVRTVSGTYAAYGQRLSIERGVVSFNGAYDNPSIDILAVRKRPDGDQLSETNVEAGVQVRGTALAPVAKLVSTPNVQDSEKLSWLVLGHGMEGTTGNEADVLSAAAGALLGGKGGTGGIQSKIANSLGLDELGVRQGQGQATGLENTVVTVGKRISSRLYLGFEQGAGTASSLVRLRYKINPRITLQLQTGTNTALDVLYSWAFD
ncbi:translocation/assembly module TamB domain-containing protein [Massilia phyllosphaerae]|uniref:translocation/assembly module TamB domain-containing protein n=1 Tax=Massilia phyllosphaerae TaxID=3106034 RepID=UPI002B1CCAFF|nr:translocation/assembly module TamB domain-containing protein [Massilia sp. SGZ-792]